jgi:hypothetical protein
MRRLTCPYRHEVIVAFASLVFASVSLLLSAFDTPGPLDIPVALVVPSVAEVRDGLSSASPRGFDFRPQVAARAAFTPGPIDEAMVVAPAHFRLQVAGAAGAGRAHALTAASPASPATHVVSLEEPRTSSGGGLSGTTSVLRHAGHGMPVTTRRRGR